MWRAVLAALVLVNLVEFALMGWDKRRARRGEWRVRERTFFLLALLGGALGGIVGMQVFRHKTKHWYFRYGLPAILILQGGLALWLALGRPLPGGG
ncbi:MULTISPECIES: DUF1294 domain-containing protein [Pseudoflavonifractor]|uniref:DUF1294 domain-containing protein n=1 Tax=Pseudoflavonifractor hominis TaxID=2763059 RepID=A0ABR7HRL0_9FIRM|nr:MULTISPECIES: DUF1294 domain-containing protein [Pseudoflavonifractor]MBC5730130.1 DUF1294 domain-containing protein [Pseudoflavonifractor hominis]MBT9685914.1 DUF1294 domain-containing protein [Pseudoflavonifractor sp. MCC625]